MRTPQNWEQLNLWFPDWRQAERTACSRLGPALAGAQQDGTVSQWWFVRKGACWRIRLQLPSDQVVHARTHIEEVLDSWVHEGTLLRWARAIYEPEVHPFGGPEGMDQAHQLFQADSHYLLGHLRHNGERHRALLAVLRACALLRGAGQDWYEHGDVFARVAAHRPVERSPTRTDVDRLSQLLRAALPHPFMDRRWSGAFHTAGAHLEELAHSGRLTRGLRAVLAHHLLFAWNRAGVGATEQGLMASAAAAAVFHRRPPQTHATESNETTTLSRVNTINDNDTTARLRHTLVENIRRRGTFRTPAVESAFLTVPRHLFLPETDLESAYQPQVVITKRDADGAALSSASHPNLVASMLEQLDARPGHRVLEIGAATGINAALLTEIVGPSGSVTTIEIDEDLAHSARHHLAEAGYDQVKVVRGDGAHGASAEGPFDRIIVTAGAWTIPTPWWEQLAPNGRLVVPVRLHGSGLTRSLPFERTGARKMVATEALVCGFVPMRGASDSPGRSLSLGAGVSFAVDSADGADAAALGTALEHSPHRVWTGITFTGEQDVAHLDLWLATRTDHFGRLSVTPQAREHGIDPTLRWAGAALHNGTDTFAYLVLRERDEDTEEIGVLAHGPDSAAVAEHLVDLAQQWSAEKPPQPTVMAQPATTPPEDLPDGTRVVKSDTVFTITW
ncbi:methyltransferase, FxLD system [Nocardiopsis nanhaiensis]